LFKNRKKKKWQKFEVESLEASIRDWPCERLRGGDVKSVELSRLATKTDVRRA